MDKKSFVVLVLGWMLLAPIFFCVISDSFFVFLVGLVYGIFLYGISKASTIMKDFWESYAKYDKQLWKSFLVR